MVKRLRNSLTVLGVGAVMAAALARPADAQPIHAWQAFLGCWTVADTDAGDSVLCFSADGAGVELSTFADGEQTSTETLLADGLERTVETDGCSGSRSVEFSSDGRRVFTRSRIACADQTRSSSGVMAFVTPDRWADVRSIEIGGEPVAWLQEYRPVEPEWFLEHAIEDPSASDPRTVLAMRTWASQTIGIDEVEEAVSRIALGAVEMWVVVQPSEFALDGDVIVRLADRGLPASLIDVMVAVSYPDRFVLSLDGAATVGVSEPPPSPVQYSVRQRGAFRSYFFDPYFVWEPYHYGWGPYPRYGGFEYPYYGYYRYDLRRYPVYSIYAPTTIVVEPRAPSSRGRMVNDRGYVPRTPSSRVAQPAGGRGSISDRGYSAPSPPPRVTSSPNVRSAPVDGASSRTARPSSPERASSPTVRPSPPARASSPAARPAPAPRASSPAARPAPAPRASSPAARPSPAPRASSRTARPAPTPRTSSPAARPAPTPRAPSPTARPAPAPAPRASSPAARPSPPGSSSSENRSSSSGGAAPRVDPSGGTATGRTARPRN